MNNQINSNKPRFTDSVDRLFIVSELFDLEVLFSDLTLENTQGIVGVIDKASNDKLLHFVTNENRLKVIWRTVVQQVNMDPLASGFRALVYHSGKIFLSAYNEILTSLNAFNDTGQYKYTTG